MYSIYRRLHHLTYVYNFSIFMRTRKGKSQTPGDERDRWVIFGVAPKRVGLRGSDRRTLS